MLDYIHDKPLYMSEQRMRDYVKELAGFIGIKRNIKVHSGRHSFAMMLVEKEFTDKEISELIGDSELITKVYARVSNKVIDNKIRERLG